MRSSSIKWVSSAAGLAMLGLLLAGCSADYIRRVKAADAEFRSIRYEVTGSAVSASVSYSNADGGISMNTNCPLPWRYAFRWDGSTRYLSVTAGNDGNAGTITVNIYAYGTLAKSSTSTGPFCVASAATTIP